MIQKEFQPVNHNGIHIFSYSLFPRNCNSLSPFQLKDYQSCIPPFLDQSIGNEMENEEQLVDIINKHGRKDIKERKDLFSEVILSFLSEFAALTLLGQQGVILRRVFIFTSALFYLAWPFSFCCKGGVDVNSVFIQILSF